MTEPTKTPKPKAQPKAKPEVKAEAAHPATKYTFKREDF